LAISSPAYSQQLVLSERLPKENKSMLFEIIGKAGDQFLIYKYLNRNHLLARYGSDMKLIRQDELTALPDKAFNLQFVLRKDSLIVVYQHQKQNIVYCASYQFPINGEPGEQVTVLDTTNIGFFATNSIYRMTTSENKKRIVIYKTHVKNGWMNFSARMFDEQFNMTDSCRIGFSFRTNRESLSDLCIDNEGNLMFMHLMEKRADDKAAAVDLISRRAGAADFERIAVQIPDLFLDEPMIRVDNINRRFLVNAFYYDDREESADGLYTLLFSPVSKVIEKTAVNPFPESLKKSVEAGGNGRRSFDQLIPRQLILRKSGGFVLLLEDFYSETLFNNNWNRGFMWNNPYGSLNDYYSFGPYGYSYRPWDDANGADRTTRFYANDVVVASVDSSLQMTWSTVIPKKQLDVDTENFLSFSFMNTGKDLKLLYIERDRSRHVLAGYSVQMDGTVIRDGSVRSPQTEIEFMPRLAKQVGARKMLVPYAYLSKLGFALIEL
jgi:hypothetical protein